MKKAILLSAGLGTRLRPITEKIPKCLVPIGGKPLLEIWLENLTQAGVCEFLINTHHLSEQVCDFVDKSPFKKMISIVHEPVLLGTAGTLKENINFFNDGDGLLIHADNYCLTNFRDFFKAHNDRNNEAEITMMVFQADKPRECGIVKINENNIVYEFHEKVLDPPGNTANGAIYILSKKFISEYKNNFQVASDFSNDVLPSLMGKINAYPIKDPLIDIGTISSLKKLRMKKI